MQCTISGGDLPMNVNWMLNGKPIPSYLDVSTSKVGKRIHVLSIDSVSAEHAGNYSCIASNVAGTANYTAPLIVIGSLSSMLIVRVRRVDGFSQWMFFLLLFPSHAVLTKNFHKISLFFLLLLHFNFGIK